MPIVVDNNFVRDTHGLRAERLNAIQGNFASIQPVLAAPANIAAWAETCYDDYTEILTLSGVETNESESATLDVATKGDLMEEEYQNARTLANGLYADDQFHLKDFGFDSAFPDNRNDKIDRVDRVLVEHARHIAEGVTTLLPAGLITRLSNAKDAYVTAINVQDKERTDARHAVGNLSRRFESDTKVLTTLKGWWYQQLGKQDERIGLIGMVNPQSGGGAHVLPAPTDLSFYFPSLTFSWSEVPGATSYSLAYSPDGIVDYVEIYNGTDTSFVYEPPQEGTTFYKIRCRSAAGFSGYSPVLAQGFYAGPTLPAPSNLAVELVTGTTDSIKLSFDAVPSANVYKIYRSTTNIGDVAGSFVYAGQSNIPEFIETIAAAGHRFYYRCTAENPHQASGNSSEVWIDIA